MRAHTHTHTHTHRHHCAQISKRHKLKPTLLTVLRHKVSPSPYCCSRLELCSRLVLFIYCVHIGLVSRQPSDVWVTRVRLSPTWSVGEFEQVWASIWRLSEEKRRRRRRESFSEWRLRSCVALNPLLFVCEVLGCLLPRYLSSLAWWEGSRESGWMREAYH